MFPPFLLNGMECRIVLWYRLHRVKWRNWQLMSSWNWTRLLFLRKTWDTKRNPSWTSKVIRWKTNKAIPFIKPERLTDGWWNKVAILHWHSDFQADGFTSKQIPTVNGWLIKTTVATQIRKRHRLWNLWHLHIKHRPLLTKCLSPIFRKIVGLHSVFISIGQSMAKRRKQL